MELDPQPRRDHEQGGGAGLRKLDFFRFSLFLNNSATDIVLVTAQARQLTAIAQCSSRWAMARGHRLNTSIVLAAVHGLFRAVSAVEPSLFRPLPLLSPSLISHLASVDVKQNVPKLLQASLQGSPKPGSRKTLSPSPSSVIMWEGNQSNSQPLPLLRGGRRGRQAICQRDERSVSVTNSLGLLHFPTRGQQPPDLAAFSVSGLPFRSHFATPIRDVSPPT